MLPDLGESGLNISSWLSGCWPGVLAQQVLIQNAISTVISAVSALPAKNVLLCKCTWLTGGEGEVSGYQPELPDVIRDSVKCARLEFALGYLWEHLQITSGLAEKKLYPQKEQLGHAELQPIPELVLPLWVSRHKCCALPVKGVMEFYTKLIL